MLYVTLRTPELFFFRSGTTVNNGVDQAVQGLADITWDGGSSAKHMERQQQYEKVWCGWDSIFFLVAFVLVSVRSGSVNKMIHNWSNFLHGWLARPV